MNKRLMIIKNKLAFVLIIIFFNSCTSQQAVYTSFWQAKDFTSADIKEPQEPLRFCDKKSKLQYTITNDDKNIYIYLKATDELYQMKIIRAGMQINIDTTGKGEKHISISFPIANKKK
ncbi:MAG: hypothetical protein HGB12_15345, partial [Bacteroidetes bacterium]|nr:hypothetical protein [Bacteroidota bacterium]